MNHIAWALIALVAYTFVPIFTDLATRTIPSDVAALVSNTILVVATIALVLVTEQEVSEYLAAPNAIYMYATGVCLAVGIITYYRALGSGPVSVVVPIFGMFIVTSSVVSAVLVPGDAFSVRKALSVVLAIAAVYLAATG